MKWDSDTHIKLKNVEFIGGEGLIEFKAFVASLPDALPVNCTAEVRLKLITNQET